MHCPPSYPKHRDLGKKPPGALPVPVLVVANKADLRGVLLASCTYTLTPQPLPLSLFTSTCGSCVWLRGGCIREVQRAFFGAAGIVQ